MIKIEISLLGRSTVIETDNLTHIEMREDPAMCSLVIRAKLTKLNEVFTSDLIGVTLEKFEADGCEMYDHLFGKRLSSYNKKIRNDLETGVTLKEMTFMFLKDLKEGDE